jgi:hypothetical protein
VQVPVAIRHRADGLEELSGRAPDNGDIIELTGIVHGDRMHVTLRYFLDATYIGPRTPYCRQEVDLDRVNLPWLPAAGATSRPATTAPERANLASTP